MSGKHREHVNFMSSTYYKNKPWEDYYVWFPTKFKGRWIWREYIERQCTATHWHLEFGFKNAYRWRLK